MVEKICPRCRQGSPLENRFCGQCGAAMEHYPVLPPQESKALVTLSGNTLPAKQLKQIGQTVAVSLVALAAEAGISYLRRRLQQTETRLPAKRAPKTAVAPIQSAEQTITVIGQQTTEVRQQGHLVRRTIERFMWQKEEG